MCQEEYSTMKRTHMYRENVMKKHCLIILSWVYDSVLEIVDVSTVLARHGVSIESGRPHRLLPLRTTKSIKVTIELYAT